MHTCKLVMKLFTSSNVSNVSILFLTHCCEVIYLAPLSYDFSYWCFVSATLFWVFCHFNFVKSLLALPLQLSCYYIYLSVGYVIRDPFKVIVYAIVDINLSFLLFAVSRCKSQRVCHNESLWADIVMNILWMIVKREQSKDRSLWEQTNYTWKVVKFQTGVR